MAQNELQVRGKTAYLSSVMEKRSQRKEASGPDDGEQKTECKRIADVSEVGTVRQEVTETAASIALVECEVFIQLHISEPPRWCLSRQAFCEAFICSHFRGFLGV